MLQLRPEWTIEQGEPVGPQLSRILRHRIISNDLPPGRRMSESEIAANFNVSRQPVREAFIKLAEEGLLEVRPQRGTFVRKISTAAVLDARFVREAIEADVVKLLAVDSRADLVAELRQQLAAQRKVIGHEPTRFIGLDEHFHRTLAEGAGKIYAWQMLEELKSQMDRVRYLSALQFPMERLVDQHTAVVDAIEAGDPLAAETAMRGHLREILADIPQIAAALPEFFETAED